MLRLLTRRARAQWPVLVSLSAVLVVGATLVGTCTLLVTRTAQRAVEVAASRADPDDVSVTAYTVTIAAKNARSVAADTRRVVTSGVAPFNATTATRASSVMRSLPGSTDDRLNEGYLSGIEDLRSHSGLISGRWPRAGATGKSKALEAVLFQNTARLLGITVGSRVRLGPEIGGGDAPVVELTVVGIIRPLADAGWDRDPLEGAGFDPEPPDNTSARRTEAYGPFVVDLEGLLNSGSALDRLEVNARPDLSAPTSRGLDRLTVSLLGLDRKLQGTLGDRVWIERVSTPIPQTLLAARNQQEVTSGSVLALALIGLMITAIALALAGRLTTGVRADESELFTALGTSRGQFALVAAVEAAGLAVAAAVVSVLASSALFTALTHLPPLAGAGLTEPWAVTGVQVLAVCGGALALALLHVGLAVRTTAGPGDRRRRREVLARSGIDVLLAGLAAVGWWQLHAEPAAGGYRGDVVRVLAPALLLTAGTALALRLVPPLLGQAERLATRARGLVLPLAAFGAARRPQAIAAGLLIGLAAAAATFGLAFDATWTAAQHDQADLAVGTDLAITLKAPPVSGQSAVVRAATGGVISPVSDHGVAVGQWLGGSGSAPRLLAVDTRGAAALLRGRLDRGRSWAEVTKPLIPTSAVTGYLLPRGSTPTLTGTATGAIPVEVTPHLLLQDETGLRTECTGRAISLDGRAHPLPGCTPVAGLRLIAVTLPVSGAVGVDAGSSITATLKLPGATAAAAAWTVRSASPEAAQLTGVAVAATTTALRMSAEVHFVDGSNLSRVLVATSFGDPGPVPVVVSTRFAADVGAHRGSKLDLTVDQTPVHAVIADIVPTVPSTPGAATALADLDTLTRTLALHGDLDSPVTAWWAGHPTRTGGAALGVVTTRASETARLTGSPLRAALPAVLRVLVAAAILLLLGGVVLQVSSDLQLRSLEVARLRGLGLSRRDIRAALFGEHAAVLLPLLVLGAAVGAIATVLVAPLLIRSDTGAAPVPAAVAHWPWGTEILLLAALIAGCALAVTAAVTVQARRADAAHLRVAS